MHARYTLSLLLVVIIVATVVSTAAGQDAPLAAQSPDPEIGEQRSVPTSQMKAPADAEHAKVWTDKTPPGQIPRSTMNMAQAIAPIPIPDAYATSAGNVLTVPAPGLIANDYHPDGASFILSNFFPPEHGTLLSIVTNGAFQYEPPPDFTGTDTFRYFLLDEHGTYSGPIEVTIEVYPDMNRAPIGVPDAYTILQDAPLVVTAPGLRANDVEPDGNSYVLSNFFPPEHGTLVSIVTDGAFHYVPPPGFTGTDSFRYILLDEHGTYSDEVMVTIHIVPAGGDAPIGSPDHYVMDAGTLLDIAAPGLIANDIDPDGDTFLLSNFFPPEHGTLVSIVTNGAFRYEPPDGFTGTDTFRYILLNGKGNYSDEVTVTIDVTALNRAPIPVADFYGMPANAMLDIAAPGLIANDVEPDGDTFILSNFFPPDSGQLLSIVTNGAFRYEPPADFTGVDTFRYILLDGRNMYSDPMTVTIFVGIDPSDPCALDDTPPEIVAHSSPTILSPANRKMHRLSVADLDISVTDNCDASLSASDVVIVAVSSDEPADEKGGPAVATDIVIGETCSTVELRAERLGGGNGRVYMLMLEVTDASGNVGSAQHEVHVPASGRPGTLAIADEPAYTVVPDGCDSAAAGAALTHGSDETDVDVMSLGEIPSEFVLEQNYPNPFNPSTSIRFGLPEDAHVSLVIYDVLGREVRRLVDGHMRAGIHAVTWNAAAEPSGIYFYRLETGTVKETRSMTLIK